MLSSTGVDYAYCEECGKKVKVLYDTKVTVWKRVEEIDMPPSKTFPELYPTEEPLYALECGHFAKVMKS